MIAQSPAELVTRIMIALVKSRSNAAESGTLQDSEVLWPRLYGTGPMSIMNVATRMLDGRTVTPLDAVNLAGMLRREQTVGDVKVEVIYWLRWGEELPEPLAIMSAFKDL